MRHEDDELLNDLLRRWHVWTVHQPPEMGFYKQNAACKLYRASRQHDDQNGALDSDAESEIMEAVDAAIDRMQQPWRTAVQFNGRNLATGAEVWTSPRIPEDAIERLELLAGARAILLKALKIDGVA